QPFQHKQQKRADAFGRLPASSISGICLKKLPEMRNICCRFGENLLYLPMYNPVFTPREQGGKNSWMGGLPGGKTHLTQSVPTFWRGKGLWPGDSGTVGGNYPHRF